MRGFYVHEADRILSAALAPPNELMSKENAAARRWVPWICTYTGARVNEIAVLKSNKMAIFTAAALAQKAVDWLTDKAG